MDEAKQYTAIPVNVIAAKECRRDERWRYFHTRCYRRWESQYPIRREVRIYITPDEVCPGCQEPIAVQDGKPRTIPGAKINKYGEAEPI